MPGMVRIVSISLSLRGLQSSWRGSPPGRFNAATVTSTQREPGYATNPGSGLVEKQNRRRCLPASGIGPPLSPDSEARRPGSYESGLFINTATMTLRNEGATSFGFTEEGIICPARTEADIRRRSFPSSRCSRPNRSGGVAPNIMSSRMVDRPRPLQRSATR
jgi:hypothetical protein